MARVWMLGAGEFVGSGKVSLLLGVSTERVGLDSNEKVFRACRIHDSETKITRVQHYRFIMWMDEVESLLRKRTLRTGDHEVETALRGPATTFRLY